MAQGGNFLVNTFTSNNQFHTNVAGYAGGFAAVWSSNTNPDGSSHDIYLKRYDNAGAVVTVETRISNILGTVNPQTGNQYTPDIAAFANGNLIIVWSDEGGNDGAGHGVYGRIFNAAGGTFGDTFLVNTTTVGNQSIANNGEYVSNVAVLADGTFVVVWPSDGNDASDNSGQAVIGQRFTAAGAKLGGEFLVNESTIGGQYQPDVTALSTGGFVVTWYNDNYDVIPNVGTTTDVYIREHTSAGVAIDGQRKLLSSTDGTEYRPAIADLGQGNYVVVYADYNTVSGTPGFNTYEIKQQLFGDAAELIAPSYTPRYDGCRSPMTDFPVRVAAVGMLVRVTNSMRASCKPRRCSSWPAIRTGVWHFSNRAQHSSTASRNVAGSEPASTSASTGTG